MAVQTIRRQTLWGELSQVEEDRVLLRERDGTPHTILYGQGEVDSLSVKDVLTYKQGGSPPQPKQRRSLQRKKRLAPRKKGRTHDDRGVDSLPALHPGSGLSRGAGDLAGAPPSLNGGLPQPQLVYSYTGPVQLHPVPRPRPKFRSTAYRRYVMGHQCISCDQAGEQVDAYYTDVLSDPHHAGERGVGQTADDSTCTPLCRSCHSHYHQTGGELPGRDEGQTALLILEAQLSLLTGYLAQQQALLGSHLRVVKDTPEEQAFADLLDESERSYALFGLDASGGPVTFVQGVAHA